VAIGTPEEVAETPESHTGVWLRRVLGLPGEAKADGPTIAAQRAQRANGTAPPASVNGASRATRSTRARVPARR